VKNATLHNILIKSFILQNSIEKSTPTATL